MKGASISEALFLCTVRQAYKNILLNNKHEFHLLTAVVV